MYIYIYVYKNIKQFCKHIYRMKKRYFWNKCCIISFLSIVEECYDRSKRQKIACRYPVF